MREVSMELALRYRSTICGKLSAESAPDLSDETIDQIMGRCVGGPWLSKAAKMLRDSNMLHLLPRPTMTRFHQVELVTRNGNALYLAHVHGSVMEWTSDAEQALTYDDLDEAEADALAYGGEVFSFDSPFRRLYPESLFCGEPAALQSAVIVRGANLQQIAAE